MSRSVWRVQQGFKFGLLGTTFKEPQPCGVLGVSVQKLNQGAPSISHCPSLLPAVTIVYTRPLPTYTKVPEEVELFQPFSLCT